MDPKKRTTIIVLLFLTILLGIASVLITMQVQRNNAANDSQAGNLVVPKTYEKIYNDLICTDVIKSPETFGLDQVDSATVKVSEDDKCEYTMDEASVSVEFRLSDNATEEFDAAAVETQLAGDMDEVIYQFSQEFEFNSEVLVFGIEDETCVFYTINENSRDLMIRTTIETEDCASEQFKVYSIAALLQDFLRVAFLTAFNV